MHHVKSYQALEKKRYFIKNEILFQDIIPAAIGQYFQISLYLLFISELFFTFTHFCFSSYFTREKSTSINPPEKSSYYKNELERPRKSINASLENYFLIHLIHMNAHLNPCLHPAFLLLSAESSPFPSSSISSFTSLTKPSTSIVASDKLPELLKSYSTVLSIHTTHLALGRH